MFTSRIAKRQVSARVGKAQATRDWAFLAFLLFFFFPFFFVRKLAREMLASRFFPRLARRVVGRSTQIPRQSKRHITFQELKEWKARIEKEFEWKKVEWRPAYGVDPFVLPDPLPDIMEPLKVTNTPGKDKPMVVLIGWLHATNKNMDKYAQLYTEAGSFSRKVRFFVATILNCHNSYNFVGRRAFWIFIYYYYFLLFFCWAWSGDYCRIY
jgi:hypothetical protein